MTLLQKLLNLFKPAGMTDQVEELWLAYKLLKPAQRAKLRTRLAELTPALRLAQSLCANPRLDQALQFVTDSLEALSR